MHNVNIEKTGNKQPIIVIYKGEIKNMINYYDELNYEMMNQDVHGEYEIYMSMVKHFLNKFGYMSGWLYQRGCDLIIQVLYGYK